MPPNTENNLLHSIVEQLTKLFELTSRIDTKTALLESEYSKINEHIKKLSDSYNNLSEKIARLEFNQTLPSKNSEEIKRLSCELDCIQDDLKELKRSIKSLEEINFKEEQNLEKKLALRLKIILTIISTIIAGFVTYLLYLFGVK